jgi:WD40 repeat protein
MIVFMAHAKPIYAVHFSPDGTRLATSSGDETVRLWALDTPEPEVWLATLGVEPCLGKTGPRQ